MQKITLEILKELLEGHHMTMDDLTSKLGVSTSNFYRNIRLNKLSVRVMKEMAEILSIPESVIYEEGESEGKIMNQTGDQSIMGNSVNINKINNKGRLDSSIGSGSPTRFQTDRQAIIVNSLKQKIISLDKEVKAKEREISNLKELLKAKDDILIEKERTIMILMGQSNLPKN